MIAKWVLGASVIAVLILAASGPGVRSGAWEWQMGFTLFRWAMYVGLAAAAVALVLLLIPKTRRPRPSLLVAALVVGLLAAAPVIALRTKAQSLPYIHDVTTDMQDPPAFVALLAARKAAPNGADYGGAEVAAAQARGYPDIRPHVMTVPREQAFERALAGARAMGWDIVEANAAAGRIEATATTAWFGFKDDIVVRVVSQSAGSRIDVRSVSRVGRSDIGANARRIQEYLSKIT
jgi:uncharacterized protein (DUF1499 family)